MLKHFNITGMVIGRRSYQMETRMIEELKRLEVFNQIRQDGTGISPEGYQKQIDDLITNFSNLFYANIDYPSDLFQHFTNNEKQFLVNIFIIVTICGKTQ